MDEICMCNCFSSYVHTLLQESSKKNLCNGCFCLRRNFVYRLFCQVIFFGELQFGYKLYVLKMLRVWCPFNLLLPPYHRKDGYFPQLGYSVYNRSNSRITNQFCFYGAWDISMPLSDFLYFILPGVLSYNDIFGVIFMSY